MAPLQMRLTMAARPCTAVRSPHYAERTGAVRTSSCTVLLLLPAGRLCNQGTHGKHYINADAGLHVGDMKVAKHSIAIAGCAIAKG